MEIYSLNFIAYLKAKGYEVTMLKNDSGLIYGYVEKTNEYDKLLKSYKKNLFLHEFIYEFKKLKTI